MQYFKTDENLISADIAYRMGRILVQYEQANIREPKFLDTLRLSTLQILLTNCQEEIRAMSKNDRKKCTFSSNISESEPVFGLSSSMIKENTFPDTNPTIEGVLTHIRNALSHPTALDIKSKYPSTGYTTRNNTSGSISTYIFIDSPDSNNNYKVYSNSERAEEIKKQIEQESGDSIKLCVEKENTVNRRTRKIIPNSYSYYLSKNNEPFTRIFRIEISVEELSEIVLKLSTYLAQPIQEYWDEKTITELVDIKPHRRAA